MRVVPFFLAFGLATALDNGLALRPQLGWNTWNSFECEMNERVVLDAAEKIVSLGFRDLGYNYVVLDDCWSAGRNESGYLVPDPHKFPNGIKDIADKVHAMGMKLGIYSSAGTLTCARYSGSLGYEEKDAAVWAEWGVDYLKYDNCFNEGEEGTPKLSYDRYNTMRNALNATGRPILYSMCNWGVDGPWNFAPTMANSWRTTGDMFNTWEREDANCPCSELQGLDCKTPGYHCSVMNVLNKAAYYPSKAYSGGWNDLDLLQVGNGGLTDNEAIAHLSLWAALKSPLIMSNVMTEVDAATLSILQNAAVLAVSQDPETYSAARVWRHYVDDGELQLYAGALSGGDRLVVLLNGGKVARQMSASLVDIFWSEGAEGTTYQVQSSWDVYDLWAARMSNKTANAILEHGQSAHRPINMTAMGGADKVYSQVPLPDTRALMGEKVGMVKPGGTVTAHVQPHGVAMLRLREHKTKNEL